ncbi:twin-arginine translocase TatA/TatE family subunit [Ilumatobacter sp.]|uniref:twin-arginine translocase TatA/TatE family subunit n=1 Tax=Ilumatobacter sp. TaxID=1967498 RepID=UPI003B521DA3
MFNLQGSEIIFILLIALVVLGPEKLPGAVRKATQTYNELRKMGTGFQTEFRSALDEPMREMRETADMIRESADPSKVVAEARKTAESALDSERSAEHALDDSAEDATDGPGIKPVSARMHDASEHSDPAEEEGGSASDDVDAGAGGRSVGATAASTDAERDADPGHGGDDAEATPENADEFADPIDLDDDDDAAAHRGAGEVRGGPGRAPHLRPAPPLEDAEESGGAAERSA